MCLWCDRRQGEHTCSLPLHLVLHCSLVNKPSPGEPSVQIVFPYCSLYKICYKLVAYLKLSES